MKILIDINHPAHVHYFKNFIKIMKANGHEIKVVNRDSKMINQLLDIYNIPHTIRNSRPNKKSTVRSLVYLMGIVKCLIIESVKFKPDIYIGFASSACAITSTIFRKPSILIDDTEHNTMNHKIYTPLCSTVLTPFYFQKELGPKQLRFQAFIEQFHLHSKYYSYAEDSVSQYGLKSKGYVLVRYIAYDAHHDMKANPLKENIKRKIVEDLSQRYQVVVSHEKDEIDSWYEKYKIEISPDKMHDIEANARFMITEGATMGAEAFVLGVPFAYINPLHVGNMDYAAANYTEVAYSGTNIDDLFTAINGFSKKYVKSSILRSELEKRTIDPTAFLVWFVENYPQSEDIIRNNPRYMEHFMASQVYL